MSSGLLEFLTAMYLLKVFLNFFLIYKKDVKHKIQIWKNSIKITSSPSRSQGECLARNRERFSNFWKMSSFFCRCPVLNEQDLVIFSWLFYCLLRRLGLPKYHSFWSLSASVYLCYREGSWCCLVDPVVYLPTLVLIDLKKLRKWLIAFPVLAVTWSKHSPVTTIAFSIAFFLYLCCSHWLICHLVWIFFFFRERQCLHIALLVSHRAWLVFVNPDTVFCLSTLNTLNCIAGKALIFSVTQVHFWW